LVQLRGPLCDRSLAREPVDARRSDARDEWSIHVTTAIGPTRHDTGRHQ